MIINQRNQVLGMWRALHHLLRTHVKIFHPIFKLKKVTQALKETFDNYRTTFDYLQRTIHKLLVILITIFHPIFNLKAIQALKEIHAKAQETWICLSLQTKNATNSVRLLYATNRPWITLTLNFLIALVTIFPPIISTRAFKEDLHKQHQTLDVI